MFFRYLGRELRRRSKQAVVVALGLAVGIGLVITVSSVSAGVTTAQGRVLHSLYGVGTDITVTKTASSPGAQHFGGFGHGSHFGTPPAAGGHFSRNTLRPSFGETTLPQSDVAKVRSVKGVADATGGLTLTDTSFSGTVPSEGSGFAPGTSFNISTFTVDGVEISRSGVGPLGSSQISKGAYFSASQSSANVAIVSSGYATQHKLKVGSTVTVAGTKLSVIGVAATSSEAADVYIPLATAQHLASMTGEVTTVYVSASSSSSVASVAQRIQTLVPASTVTTSASLANEVSGSLSNAASLASSLGRWLSWIALAVAFAVAALLMMAAVSRRVREFGTLKAIGWRSRRIVRQVMGEGLALGIAGGVFGIVLGLAGAGIISAISPTLSATAGATAFTGGNTFTGGAPFVPGGFAGRGVGGFAHRAAAAAHTVLVHLTAPLQMSTVLLAIGLSVLGGLIAGGFGAWRAARLRPAAALRKVE